MVLTEFHTMFLGTKLHIYTDHWTSHYYHKQHHFWLHYYCWLNYIEQFNPYIHFNLSKDNVIANMFAWLDCLE